MQKKDLIFPTLLIINIIAVYFTRGSAFHNIMRIIFVVLLTLDVIDKRKWMFAIGKNLKSGKIPAKIRNKFWVALILLVIWYIAIGFGIVAAITGQGWISQVYSLVVVVALLVTALHIWQMKDKIYRALTNEKE